MSSKYDALCVSSGGVKGFCALGALQYIQDSKRMDVNTIKHLSGTSVGAFICLFMAIGYTPIELMVYLCTHKMFEEMKFKKLDEMVTGDGVYDFSTIQHHCESMCISKMHYIPTLAQLHETLGVEMTFATYNLTKTRVEYLSHHTHPDLSCLDAARMSSNLPFLFSPFVRDGCEYIDGALVDDFPVSQLPYRDLSTLGIYLKDHEHEPDEADSKRSKLFDITNKFFKILTIPIRELHQVVMKTIDKEIDIITIEVPDVPIYRFDLRKEQRLELFSLGYNAARQYFEST